MSQYMHDQWGVEQGFPGGTVYAITQTPDGYLWIGCEKGLVRFDGFSFQLLTAAGASGLPPGPVEELAADGERNLWVRQQSAALLRYRDGRFGDVLQGIVNGRPIATAMCRGENGDILFLAPARGVLRSSRGKIETVSHTTVLHNFLIISIAETGDKKIWMGARDAGLFAWDGHNLSNVNQGLPDKKINTLLPSGSEELWVGTDNGVVRWDGVHLTRAGIPAGLQHGQILTMAKDRESNLWLGTATGLLRMDPKGTLVAGHTSDPAGSAVHAIFEDREGNLWVGTDGGLERFRDSAFLTYPLSARAGSKANGSLFADEQGRTWFVNAQGRLQWQRGTETGYLQGFPDDTIYSITGFRGDLWVGRKRGGLTRIRCHPDCLAGKTYTHADGLAQDTVYSLHESADGTLWAGTVSAGVTRIRNGKFSTYTAASGLASNTVNAIAETLDGTVWFGTPDGLSALTPHGWRVYRGRDGLPLGGVNCLLADANGIVWIGTSKGLAFFRSGRIQTTKRAPRSLSEEILGVASDNKGWLWVATSQRIFRISRQSVLAGSVEPADLREYGLADGLLGGSTAKRNRSVIADSLGCIWFSTNRGLSVVDPSRLAGDSVPAIVHIQTVSADGALLAGQRKVVVPPIRKRIVIGYVGLSLSVPDRVRYRYKLEGFDRDWSEPTTAREAIYTNLNPGLYKFRLAASNANGIWKGRESTVALDVEPAFWQTWWFRISGVLALALVVAALYRLRLHQITSQLDLRFEERLSERTRIAQDLHDTLLQGFLSASMQLHVAFGRLDEKSSARPPLSRAIELMGKASQDGRMTLRELRSSQTESLNLEQAFSSIPSEISIPEEIRFRLRVEGRQQLVRPALQDDVYRICREAILNALRHSKATDIQVELAYASNQLRVLVQDNGCGMDGQVLTSGREGHWGLKGMRERAERIGAKLSVLSSPGAGTEVVLCVPGHIAFQPGSVGKRRTWFRRLPSIRGVGFKPERKNRV